MAADVLRDGHGQDVGWLLCQQLQHRCVSSTIRNPRNAETEATFNTRLAAFTEQPKLETLLILALFEPVPQGLSDIEGQPFVFQFISNEAGSEVACRGP